MPLLTMEAAVGMRYVITEPISFFCSGWQACVMKLRDHCVSQKPSKGLPTCSTCLGLTPQACTHNQIPRSLWVITIRVCAVIVFHCCLVGLYPQLNCPFRTTLIFIHDCINRWIPHSGCSGGLSRWHRMVVDWFSNGGSFWLPIGMDCGRFAVSAYNQESRAVWEVS